MVADRYELGRLLGEGGLGMVHLAWDHRLLRQVAIKRLRHQPDTSGRLLERGMQEALNLAAAQHPHIVTIYDYGQDEEGPFVVMEYVQGETLEQRIARCPLDEANFLLLARQCLEGLSAAHANGVIHRDLKPSNVMLAESVTGLFQVKILDFGLAKIINRPSVQSGAEGESIFGSIYYMAPEQFNRQPLDARTDLYALGCIFYESLCGVVPFGGEVVAEVMASHLAHNVTPLEQRLPELRPDLAAWIMRMLAFRPADRPPHAAAALSQLQHLVDPTQRLGLEELPPKRKARSPMLALALAAVLLGLIMSAFVSGWFNPSPAFEQSVEQTAFHSPTDLPALRGLVGERVRIEGTVLASGVSRSGDVHYLNFARPYHRAASLVFFASDHPELTRESLDPFVGKTVVATGVLQDYRGNLQIPIQSLEQITLAESGGVEKSD